MGGDVSNLEPRNRSLHIDRPLATCSRCLMGSEINASAPPAAILETIDNGMTMDQEFNELVANGSFRGNCTFVNGTCGEVDKYNWWALSLLVFPLLTLFGNVLVILSVSRERSLQTATNYFIVSLAVADLLVAVVVMPFGVYYLFYGMSWNLPAVLCDCYIAMDVTCSTSSIFNLVAISVDRYIAVTQPIKYAKHRSNGRVWSMIAMAWLVSGAIGSPIVLGLNYTPDRVENQCLFNSKDYVIFSSLGSFYIPCIIMMFLYYRIFKAIRERAKKQRSAKRSAIGSGLASTAVVIESVAHKKLDGSQDDALPTGTTSGSNEDEDDENSDRTEMGAFTEELAHTRSARFMLAAVVEETGLIMANLASPIPMMDPNTNNDSGYAPSNVEGEKEHTPPPSPNPGADEKPQETAELPKKPELRKKMSRLSSASLTTPRRRFRSAASAARFTIFRGQRAAKLGSKSFAKKEKKATQTLAIVLGVFLICWAPFFTCNVLDAVCGKLSLPYSPGVTAFILTTWLGYVNSFLNPVIYTIFNPEFRKAFRKILKCGA